jgi:hypothetical protein
VFKGEAIGPCVSGRVSIPIAGNFVEYITGSNNCAVQLRVKACGAETTLHRDKVT